MSDVISEVIPIPILNWLATNQDQFKSGVRSLWLNQNFSVLLLVGPNPRDEYHVNPGSEVYYQLKGDIVVKYFDTEGQRHEQLVREGEVWLLGAKYPHQPYRPEGTVGLVVEHAPGPGEASKTAWYCENCDHLLHEVKMGDGYASAPRTGSEPWRTCSSCGQTLARP